MVVIVPVLPGSLKLVFHCSWLKLSGVSHSTVSKLMTELDEVEGVVKDRPRRGHSKKKTAQKDRFVTLSEICKQRSEGRYVTCLWDQMIRNRLHTASP